MNHSRSLNLDATFYCDESGNTGVHWSDPQQPVFIHGGWLIPTIEERALLKELSEIKSRHQLQAPELKWKQLARRNDGSAVFKEIFQAALDHAALPFFIAIDKAYLIAAKTVETFFDPAYNTFFDMSFTSAFDVKRDFAEMFLLYPSGLAKFAEMLRSGVIPEPSEVVGLASEFADYLETNNAPRLAETLRHFSPENIDDIRKEFGLDVWMRTTLGHSMFALMQRLEHFLRLRNVRTKIIHDNIVRFDYLFETIQGMFRESDGNDISIINGEPRYFSMPTVDDMRLADSKQEPFIQLADMLVGFLRTVLTNIIRGGYPNEVERAICGDLVALFKIYHSWEIIAPKSINDQLFTIGFMDLKRRFPL